MPDNCSAALGLHEDAKGNADRAIRSTIEPLI